MHHYRMLALVKAVKNCIMLIYSVAISTSMTLGQCWRGRCQTVAGLRALGDGIIEVSLQGKGTLLGSEMEDVTTFGSVMRPNGKHMVKGIQFKCLLKVWQNGVVPGLENRRGPVRGSMPMAVYIQLLHLRNGRDCLMFSPQANMKMMLMEITTGNYGNGNSDILKELIIRGRHFFIPICADIISSVVIPQLRKI